jgi:hypothetical protein
LKVNIQERAKINLLILRIGTDVTGEIINITLIFKGIPPQDEKTGSNNANHSAFFIIDSCYSISA